MKDLVFALIVSLSVVAASMLKNETNNENSKNVINDQKFISYSR